MNISPALRELVTRRAGGRCEYCRIREDADPLFRFHIEHVIAKQHRGATDESNLAHSCHHCNLHKGPNLTAIDPANGAIVTLFNPRTQRWEDHFTVADGTVSGLTPVGRATLGLLRMNTCLGFGCARHRRISRSNHRLISAD